MPEPLITAAKQYQAHFTGYHQRRTVLLQTYAPTLFSLSHEDIIQRLTTQPKALLDHAFPDPTPADILVLQREALQANLTRIGQVLDRLEKSLPVLAASSGLETPTQLAGIEQLCKAAECIVRDPKPLAEWFSRTRIIELKAQAEEAGLYYSAYRDEQAQIRGRYQETFFSLDIAGLYQQFTGPYAGVLRLMNPSYYRDLKRIRAERRDNGKLSYKEATRDVKTARQALERKQWIEARAAEHGRVFGRHYYGLDTRWPEVLESLETTRQLVDSLGEERLPEATKRLLIESGPAIASVAEQNAVVLADWTRMEKDLLELQHVLSLQGLPFTNRVLRDADLSKLKAWIAELAACLRDFLNGWDIVQACRQDKPGLLARSVAEVVQDLQEAQALVQIEEGVQTHAEKLQTEFGHLFTGMDTRWENVLASLDWTGQVMDWFGEAPPTLFVDVACGQRPGADQITESLINLRSVRQRINEESEYLISLFSDLRINDKVFTDAPLVSIRDWLALRLVRLPDLDQWMDFQRLRSVCLEERMATYLDLILRDKPAADQLKPAFYKRFWTLWLDNVYHADPALVSFDGSRHEEYIARFRKLDQEQLEIARRRLQERLWQARPKTGNGANPTGEMSILLREKAKKKRHKSLRRLFQEIPNLLLALAPCLLMSPLSVATFLDPENFEFDTVIFDEASQICSEDAVGAIMRGKQIIVVGDSKQLPPTRFFSAGVAEDYDTEDEEDEAATEVYESILDECSTISLPQWMLRWHYRSRCEALIAFSNKHFYEDKLVTFPGPHVTDMLSADRCVEFVSVPDGVYIRGKGQDAGANRVEARKVAALVMEHFRSRPNRSLGVIAFSERQQTAIDDELRLLRKQNQEYETFFSEQGNEPFFLKNLENVQGDERDTILFSVGYGRDQQGKLTMNFGPLNKEGGERRLNVAITRAKHQVKLVSSIQPQDIDLTRTDKKGPQFLKYYMEFAKSGPSALGKEIEASADPDFDSPFEEEVCRALEARGLVVHRQIGCAGYRIDLAIVDDKHPGRYRLGIECDGATYHSSKTARDRDRLRQQILEEMGWRGRILRVWSSDWFQNREGQLARILQASEKIKDIENDSLLADEVVIKNRLTEELESVEVGAENQDQNMNNLFSAASDSERDAPMPEEIVTYQVYVGDRLGEPAEFYEIAKNEPECITDILVNVVKQEGPIHIEEATRRVVACWGMKKAGFRLLQIVQEAAMQAQNRGTIAVRDEFLWPAEMSQCVVRVPTTGDRARSIEHVPLEEITEACIQCVRGAYAIEQDELITQAARLLGHNRTGSNIQERIAEAISHASNHGKLDVKEGKVLLG